MSKIQINGPVYETQLERDPRWALSEGSRHFEERSAVFAALHKVTKRLQDLDIAYAIVGGMALFQHGLRRFTEDVDILVTKEDLKKIHEHLEGRGYLPPRRGSKHLRDTELGVRIEFLTTGEYPGDGRTKPVAFPEPDAVSVDFDGVRYVNLPTLIELKLASGMTNPGRLKDLADVLELIKVLNLPAELADTLNPYVRERYLELWNQGRRRYITLWRPEYHTADRLGAMRNDGITLEDGSSADDPAFLVTTDPEIARKYDMVEESEYWGEGEGE